MNVTCVPIIPYTVPCCCRSCPMHFQTNSGRNDSHWSTQPNKTVRNVFAIPPRRHSWMCSQVAWELGCDGGVIGGPIVARCSAASRSCGVPFWSTGVPFLH